MKPHVEYRLDNDIAVIVMDSPPVNAFTDQFHSDFLQVLAELQGREIRAAIITGTGRYFHSGGDVHRFLTLKTLEDAEAFVKLVQGFMDVIAALSYPMIAAVNGYALGGGLEIALACDIRIVSDSALLGLPLALFSIADRDFPGPTTFGPGVLQHEVFAPVRPFRTDLD